MVGVGESEGGGGEGGGGVWRESEGKSLQLHYKKSKDAVVMLKCEHSFTRRSMRYVHDLGLRDSLFFSTTSAKTQTAHRHTNKNTSTNK